MKKRIFEKFLIEEGFDVYTLAFDRELKSDANIYSFYESGSRLKRKLTKFVGSKDIKNFIRASLKEINPDLVHIHLVSKYPADLYACLNGYKVLQTLHGPNLFCTTSWGGFKNGAACELGIGSKCYLNGCASLTNTFLYVQLSKRYMSFIKQNIDLFHSPSRQMYSSCKRLGFENTLYQPLGIDEVFSEPVVKPKNSRPVLLFVGALNEVKGIKVLMQAMLRIVEKYPEVILKIAGRGDLTAWLKNFISKNELDQNVTLLGFVDHREVRDLYIEADIFLMPSVWQEQFGLVGPEALACETPCIASNVGGIPEWLHHNQWGYLVPPLSINDLSQAVIDLLSNAEKRKAFGRRGRKFVLREYSSKQYKKGMLKIIKGLLHSEK